MSESKLDLESKKIVLQFLHPTHFHRMHACSTRQGNIRYRIVLLLTVLQFVIEENAFFSLSLPLISQSQFPFFILLLFKCMQCVHWIQNVYTKYTKEKIIRTITAIFRDHNMLMDWDIKQSSVSWVRYAKDFFTAVNQFDTFLSLAISNSAAIWLDHSNHSLSIIAKHLKSTLICLCKITLISTHFHFTLYAVVSWPC